MKLCINSQYYDIPTQSDGSILSGDVRKMAGIPSDRALILQRPNGENLIVNAGEQYLHVNPDDYFIDTAIAERG